MQLSYEGSSSDYRFLLMQRRKEIHRRYLNAARKAPRHEDPQPAAIPASRGILALPIMPFPFAYPCSLAKPLAPSLAQPRYHPARIQIILNLVSHLEGIPVRDLKSASRKGPTVKARHLACFLARDLPPPLHAADSGCAWRTGPYDDPSLRPRDLEPHRKRSGHG